MEAQRPQLNPEAYTGSRGSQRIVYNPKRAAPEEVPRMLTRTGRSAVTCGWLLIIVGMLVFACGVCSVATPVIGGPSWIPGGYDSGSWSSGGWDSSGSDSGSWGGGSDSGSWDSGGWGGGSDSGSWDSGVCDSGSWDSGGWGGGSDSGSW